jgi:formate dehydrogenase
MPETHHTFCRICESLCGLEVTVDGGEVTQIRPDDHHVATAGFACLKGVRQHKLYRSPDRLRHPMVRHGDTWSALTWPDALGQIGSKVRSIVEAHGPQAVAMYVGTAAGFSVLHPVFAKGFMDGLGSESLYASATQDCANKFAAARELYGFDFTQPFPDVDRTQCLIIVGANPVVSKWSFLQVADPTTRLREIAARGGRVVVVDPRRTETARVATDHIFIRPDTDVFFYLAFLHELIASGGVDHQRVEAHMSGFDDVVALVQPWTPERCGEVTGIDAATLRAVVSLYRQARGAALYCSTGVNMGSQGVLSFWLQEVINAVSGNLDAPGGTLVGRGIFDFAKFAQRTGTLMSTARSRIGGFGKVNDAFPGGILADEILTPGPGQIRALFVTGGNPLITMADAGRLRHALASLELLVTIDIYRNETGSLAHYTLPATDPLQRPDLPFVFPLLLGMQSRPYLQATRAVVAPEADQRDEASIYLDLAEACGAPLFGSKVAQGLLSRWARRHSRRRGLAHRTVPAESMLNAILRLSRQPGFRSLLSHPHGLRRSTTVAGTFLGRRVVTDDGRVHLSTDRLLARASGLDEAFTAVAARRDQMLMITKRHVKTHNSWTHNHADMLAGDFTTNHVYLHPDDADRLGLGDDDWADVTSTTASIRLPVRLAPDVMPGVCAVPHGWGHQHATGLTVASTTTGVNVNLLAASGPDSVDSLSGMSQLTGIPVEVRRASGPPDTTSWSGWSPSADATNAREADG